MGRSVFLSDAADVGRFESCVLKPGLQLTFVEAEPMISVELAGFFELVFQEVENNDLAARAQDAMP